MSRGRQTSSASSATITESLDALQFGSTHTSKPQILQTTNIADAKIKGGELDLKHFLMGLYYLRKYPTEEDHARNKTWGARQINQAVMRWDKNE